MNFMDYLTDLLGVKNDAALARTMHLTPPAVSKYRSGVTPIGPNLIIRAHELTGVSIRVLKGAAGIPCLPIGGRH